MVCISDTHNAKPKIIPFGDILIHAGDLTQGGTKAELQATLDWIKAQPHHHKIVVAGNYELVLDSAADHPKNDEYSLEGVDWGNIIYLQDRDVKVQLANGRSLNIYGSPWTRKQGNWAFQYTKSDSLAHWHKAVPDDTDILVTHMPPRFHLDIDGSGDEDLLQEMRRVRPALHVFGHFHGGYGEDRLSRDGIDLLYEGVCRGDMGRLALVRMALHLGTERLFGASTEPTTKLVNAAHMGGFRDNLRRNPIVVIL